MDNDLPVCPDCQQGYVCEHCGKPIEDYFAAATAAPRYDLCLLCEAYHRMAQRETQLAEKFITAVKGEQLHEDLDNPEDAGYRNAINDVLRARIK